MIPHHMLKRKKIIPFRLQTVGLLTCTVLAAGISLAHAQSSANAKPAATPSISSAVTIPASATVSSATALSARGVIRPWHEVKIAVELAAKVKTLPLRVGDRFQKSDLLLEFDCARFHADLRAAKATEAEHAALHKTNVTLRKHRAAGSNEVEISRARLAKATAEAESLGHRISQCKIIAPFAGRIAERMTDQHELPQANQPLLRIVNDGDLEVALIVPANWLRWLKVDAPFDFTLDDTGASGKATVTRLGAAIDPVSQTVEIFAKLQGATGHVLPGMSGTARFPQPQG